MFESLSDRLHDVLKKLRGESRLTEENISGALREIRIALLEADVNLKIADEFIESVKKECVGQDVLRSVTPGQQVIKIVHDALVDLFGEAATLNLQNRPEIGRASCRERV